MTNSIFFTLKSLISGRVFGLMGQQLYLGFWLLMFRIGGLFLMMLTLILSLGLHYLIIDYGISAWVLLYMILLTIPGTLFVIIPFSAILSAVILMHRLNQYNELIVMRIAGFSTWRMMKPIALIGLILATIGWINGLWILPESSQTFNKINRSFRTQDNEISLKASRFNHFGENIMLYARAVTEENLYQDVLISIQNDDGNHQILIAQTGKFDDNHRRPGFVLSQGSSQDYNPEARKLNVTQFETYKLRLSEDEVDEISYWMKSSERFIMDLLFPDLDNPSDRSRYHELVTKGHDRLMTPIYFLLLPIITALLMLHAPFDRRRFIGKVISVSIISFSIYILHRVGLNIAAGNIVLLGVPYALLGLSCALVWGLIQRKNPLAIDILSYTLHGIKQLFVPFRSN